MNKHKQKENKTITRAITVTITTEGTVSFKDGIAQDAIVKTIDSYRSVNPVNDEKGNVRQQR